MKKELSHYMLIFYTLRYLPQKDKVKVLRELHGYSERKKGKQYNHIGLTEKFNSEKLGSNVILAPMNHFVEFQNFFSKHDIKIKVREAWLK
jgi:hypothetical protein